MTPAAAEKITLQQLRQMRSRRRPFAMLTAYDFPTAVAAQAAGVHSLLIGDSMGTVLLGHPNTRQVPLELMLILGAAVRRGAPAVYLIGDLPFESISGGREGVLNAARRFRMECGCDGVKLEVGADQCGLVAALAGAGHEVVAHLGLRPQEVLTPDGYRAQARDPNAIEDLVEEARAVASAGAAMILLEAVPAAAAAAVAAAIEIPLVGCGAGDACDGHVVVTQDLLGLSPGKPPRFVPVMAHLGNDLRAALAAYVADVETRRYPRPEHMYPMKQTAAGPVAP